MVWFHLDIDICLSAARLFGLALSYFLLLTPSSSSASRLTRLNISCAPNSYGSDPLTCPAGIPFRMLRFVVMSEAKPEPKES
jgi:hypothetical protein